MFYGQTAGRSLPYFYAGDNYFGFRFREIKVGISLEVIAEHMRLALSQRIPSSTI